MKTVGAITNNKNIKWKVEYSDGNAATYTNLADLCLEEKINRSSVYKLVIGRSKPTRKKHLASIEKIYYNSITGEYE